MQMYSSPYSIDDDLRLAGRMANDLERHLHSNVMYSAIGGGTVFGSQIDTMSVGNLIATIHRLRAIRPVMTEIQRNVLGNISTIYEMTRFNNASQFVGALNRELSSRLGVIQYFLDDIDHSGTSKSLDIQAELLQRTVVQEMLSVIYDLDMEDEKLTSRIQKLDHKLSAILCEKAPFRWAAILKVAYPQGTFWWLYRRSESDLGA